MNPFAKMVGSLTGQSPIYRPEIADEGFRSMYGGKPTKTRQLRELIRQMPDPFTFAELSAIAHRKIERVSDSTIVHVIQTMRDRGELRSAAHRTSTGMAVYMIPGVH